MIQKLNCIDQNFSLNNKFPICLQSRQIVNSEFQFRFVVFRPFIDEVIEAKVLSSNAEGLIVSLIFFEDIFVPAHRLPQPSVFEQEEQVKIKFIQLM